MPGQLGYSAGGCGDLVDHGGDALDRVIDLTTAIDSIVCRRLRRFGRGHRVARHFFHGGSHLIDGRCRLLDFVVLASQPAGAFIGDGAQFFGSGSQLVRGTGNLLNSIFQTVLHIGERVQQLSGFIATVRNNRLSQVTARNALSTGDCDSQRTGDHAGNEHAEHDGHQKGNHHANLQHQYRIGLQIGSSGCAFLDLTVVGIDHGAHVTAHLGKAFRGQAVQLGPGSRVITRLHQVDNLLRTGNISGQHQFQLVTGGALVIFQRRGAVSREHLLRTGQVITQCLTNSILVRFGDTAILRIQQTVKPAVVSGETGQRFIGVANRDEVVGKSKLKAIAQAGHSDHPQSADGQRDQCTNDESREKLGRKLGLTQDVHGAYLLLNEEWCQCRNELIKQR